ncbi:MAG: NGG1p interacting factor NIF3 [Candidatus Omnitrophota bacterium]|nr:NGG1p interacting factor NIF3 [Candidatus Omnitrophota bacterium]
MKLKEIYDFVVKRGMEKDPRSKNQIRSLLVKSKKEFRKLKGIDAKCYDRERFTNPYADTRILNGEIDQDIRSMMVGIDMEGPELLVADRLNEKGKYVDLVMAHHPEGKAYANFYDVMHLQEAAFEKLGVPIEIGKELLKERIGEVSRAVSGANHLRSVDIAKLLDIPYMCVHTPADNHVNNYLQGIFDKRRPKTLNDALNILKAIPEYADALAKNAGPHILIGDAKKKCGKVFVDMTGGTEGPKRIFPRLSQAGVGTIVAMHLNEEHFKQAKTEFINVIIAGHIASDTLGLNLLLDALLKKEAMKIIPCSGYVRIRR